MSLSFLYISSVTPSIHTNPPGGNPEKEQQKLLSDLIANVTKTTSKNGDNEIHSLLENDLGVQLPLHISLSRPLTLKTANKDTFLINLTSAITTSKLHAFTVSPATLVWHSNEDSTRWFLVLSLQRPHHDELRSLLAICNQLAKDFEQPLLYEGADDGKFHVSVAWSLTPQEGEVRLSEGFGAKLRDLLMGFREVKVRIGQDVTSISLKKRRAALFGDEAV